MPPFASSGWRCRHHGSRVAARSSICTAWPTTGPARAGLVERFLSSTAVDVVAYDSRAHGDVGGRRLHLRFPREVAISDAGRRHPRARAGHPRRRVARRRRRAAGGGRRPPHHRRRRGRDVLRPANRRRASGRRWIVKAGSFGRALRVAETPRRRFLVDDVSPVRAAAVDHGAGLSSCTAPADRDTPPAALRAGCSHALAGPKHLELVPGVGHNQSLQPQLCGDAVARWLTQAVHASA